MKNVLLFISFIISIGAVAQQQFWETGNFYISNEVTVDLPSQQSAFTLNESAMLNRLLEAPMRSSGHSNITISIPIKNEPEKLFEVFRTSSIHPELSTRYGGIYSFKAVSPDGTTAYVSYSKSLGFRIDIDRSPQPTQIIKRYDNQEGRYIMFTRDVMQLPYELDCQTVDELYKVSSINSKSGQPKNDGFLRKYRLAISTTGEFTQYFLDGTETSDMQRIAKVTAGVNATLTRMNGIFERDLGLVVELIPNADLVFFINPNTDPYDSGTWNSQLQGTLDSVIGSANYDLGQLFAFDTQVYGNAGCIACVCTEGIKGSAFTAHNIPDSDHFALIAAHEMGHQLGGFHTMSSQNCRSGGGRQEVEPGSGSTIMGYSGICTPNVQQNPDDYYNYVNIRDIIQWTRFDSSCAQTILSNNDGPTADAGSDFTIPFSTPFILTGSGSDVNTGDVLSYCWEQNDPENPNSASAPSPSRQVGPMFRSLQPKDIPNRYMPSLNDVLSNNLTPTWEVLPSSGRRMTFALTVRDNAPTGGKTASDEMIVTVDETVGPFTVNLPVASDSWVAGTTETITWNVANTDQAPVNTQFVDIYLSLDNGQNFDIPLALSTPNDGSEIITVPVAPANAQARVMVKSVGNIYYALNPDFFTYARIDYALDFVDRDIQVCQPQDAVYNFTYQTYNGFNETTTFSVNNLTAGLTATFNPASASVDGTVIQLTISDTDNVSSFSHSFTAQGQSNATAIQRVTDLDLTIYDSVISAPPLSTPVNMATNQDITPVFNWQADPNVLEFTIEIATDSGFANIVESAITTASVYQATSLNYDTDYFWRVIGTNSCSTQVSSNIFTFETLCAAPEDVAIGKIRTNSVELSWTELGNATSWQIEVVAAGNTPTGNTTTITSNPHTITGLAADTAYEVYIYATCASTNLSAQIGPVGFATLPDFCGGVKLIDSGGTTGEYSNNETVITTIYPNDPADRVRAQFDFVSIEEDFDFLFILNGPTTQDPIIGQLTGTGSFPDLISTHPSGALTFIFLSDEIVTAPGYEVSIICQSTIDCSTVTAPFYENFEADFTPDCWLNAGTEPFLFSIGADYNAATAGDNTPGGTTNYAWIDASTPNGPGQTGILQTPQIDVSGLTEIGVSFSVYSNNPDSNSYNTLIVNAIDEIGDSVELLNQNSSTSGWFEYTYNLSTSLQGAQSIVLEIQIEQDAPVDPFFNDILIDDVRVDEFVTLSTSTVSLIEGLSIYPIPANDQLYVRADIYIDSFTMYDMQGRIIKSSDLNAAEEFSIDVKSLSTGSYIIKLNAGKKTVNKQFIIE